jgi:hypothetical protein
MPRHKVKQVGRDKSKWCGGSGQKPYRSVLMSERTDPDVQPSTLGKYDGILDWKAGSGKAFFRSWQFSEAGLPDGHTHFYTGHNHAHGEDSTNAASAMAEASEP